jgi:hypothetical protein
MNGRRERSNGNTAATYGVRQTWYARAAKGIIDPSTGKPVGSDDAFFGDINNELADKGFLVTSTMI